MMIPIRTDAPIYHFPFVTIGLIVVNVFAFVGVLGASKGDLQGLILQYGDGLHPLQWITSNFIHGGLMHLIGNMIFLWTFGLVVEGKVGPLVFLPLYLGIGFVQCGVEQAIMSTGGEGGSYGASAILFGLVCIAMFWAPKNDVTVAGLIVFRPFVVDLPIAVFAALFVLWEIVLVWLTGFGPTTPVLHLSGALVGAVVGWAMLKWNAVDCEGWDLLSVMSGGPKEPKRKKKR